MIDDNFDRKLMVDCLFCFVVCKLCDLFIKFWERIFVIGNIFGLVVGIILIICFRIFWIILKGWLIYNNNYVLILLIIINF